MTITRTMTLSSLQGETDLKAASIRNAQIVGSFPVDDPRRKTGVPVPCEAIAIYTAHDGSKMEIVVTDWAEISSLAKTITLTF